MASTQGTHSFTLLLIIFVASAYEAASRTFHEATMLTKHEQWMALHERVYESSLEREKRFKIFKANVEFIESFNQAGNNHTYTLGTNKFTDLTTEEFLATYTGNVMKPSSQKTSRVYKTFKYKNLSDVPPSIDWRQQGAVTAVKNQGQCGCCWAFTAVAAVEGLNQIKTGQLISLSEQEILDCDGELDGCSPNTIEHAFQFIQQNQGLTTESAYPYVAQDQGICPSTDQIPAAATINGYGAVPPNDEEALQMAVASQPVSVAVDAQLFQSYKGGIISGPCGTRLTHAITAVGYGISDEGMKFWIFKNSWGENWGENGYVRIQRDVESKEGMCGIAKDSWYPTA